MEKPITPIKFYRPELDGLRFFAFFLVFLQHLTMPSGSFKVRILTGFIFNLHLYGWIGVDLFLCLSSYLITKILFLEWKLKGDVSVKDFYIRRILRIWPLYFLACLLGFLVFPLLGWFGVSYGDPAYQTLIHNFLAPYLLLVGNWATLLLGYPAIGFLSTLWTISLEEQFYLVGPILFRLFRFEKRAILKLSGFLLILTFAARFGAWMMGTKYPAIWVCTLTRLDPFVLGTCLAMFEDELVLFKGKISEVVWGVTGLTLLAVVLTFTDFEHQTVNDVWKYFFLDFGFCCLIFSVTHTDRLKRFFSSWLFVQLGKISYGLYVYHVLGYFLANSVLRWFLFWVRDHLNYKFSFMAFETLVLLMALTITICISLISYYCFERVFLQHKSGFTTIKSRPV
jgi:peptidoglycan/LPS O-acetylase OafA/YrhL